MSNSRGDLYSKITEKGNEIRAWKAAGFGKEELKPQIAELLALKREYKELTGEDYSAAIAEPSPLPQPTSERKEEQADRSADDLYTRITTKGDEIRALKAAGQTNTDLQSHINELLTLKREYRELTGHEYVPAAAPSCAAPTTEAIERVANISEATDDLAFRRYHSIENHTSKYAQEILEYPPVANARWLALEKVHGANFALYTNGTEIVCARRQSVLSPTDTFYNFRAVVGRYEAAVHRFFQLAKLRWTNLTLLRIFGELYGGIYANMPKPNGSKHLNKDIQYCPHNDWIAFEAQIVVADGDAGHGITLPHEVLVELCDQANIPVIRPLHSGTLQELLALDPLFLTTIPRMHGLPQIEDNYAEGFVLITAEPVHFKGSRAMLKFKNVRFCEMHNAQYHVSESKATKVAAPAPRVPPELMEEALAFVTEARLTNVWTKLTDDEHGDKKYVTRLFVQDAFEDFRKHLEDTERPLNNRFRSVVTSAMSERAGELITAFSRANNDHNSVGTTPDDDEIYGVGMLGNDDDNADR